MLEEKYIKMNPDWWRDLNKDKYYTIITNDLDGLFSGLYLQKKCGMEIGGFYDFKRGVFLNDVKAKDREPVYVDCCLAKGKCFDNHYSLLTETNEEMWLITKTRW